METLKEFHEITKSDKCNTFWLLTDQETNIEYPIPLEQWYQQVKSIHLIDEVPKELISEFNVAKNLAIYSWFCFSFHSVAATKALSVLKNALAEKFNYGFRIDEKSEFELLLKQIINKGTLKGSEYLLDDLPKMISNLRYDFEQESQLYKNSWITLKLCAELINQVYLKN